MSRDKLFLRADFANFFPLWLRQASSVSGNVFRLHFRLLVHQRDCTKHLLRVERHRDGGYREHCYGSLRPRNVSVPSYRPTQRKGCTSVCASEAQVRVRGSHMIRRYRSPYIGSRSKRPSNRRGIRDTGPPCSYAFNDAVSKSSRASCAGRSRQGPVRPQARSLRSATH